VVSTRATRRRRRSSRSTKCAVLSKPWKERKSLDLQRRARGRTTLARKAQFSPRRSPSRGEESNQADLHAYSKSPSPPSLSIHLRPTLTVSTALSHNTIDRFRVHFFHSVQRQTDDFSPCPAPGPRKENASGLPPTNQKPKKETIAPTNQPPGTPACGTATARPRAPRRTGSSSRCRRGPR